LNANEFATGLLKLIAYASLHNKKRGGVMETLEAQENCQENYRENFQANSDSRRAGFCIQDIIWAVGIWSVILTLSPVVMFYVLMVN
jgi:hypothetical protein